jgi:hypothetical protein
MTATARDLCMQAALLIAVITVAALSASPPSAAGASRI